MPQSATIAFCLINIYDKVHNVDIIKLLTANRMKKPLRNKKEQVSAKVVATPQISTSNPMVPPLMVDPGSQTSQLFIKNHMEIKQHVSWTT